MTELQKCNEAAIFEIQKCFVLLYEHRWQRNWWTLGTIKGKQRNKLQKIQRTLKYVLSALEGTRLHAPHDKTVHNQKASTASEGMAEGQTSGSQTCETQAS